LHLIALVESAQHVCCRYRLKAFQAGLRAAGHELEFKELPEHWWERWRLGGELQHADAVIVQRKLLLGLHVTALRKQVKRLIFDFDDAVFLRDSFSEKGPNCPRRAKRFAAMMRNADAITAGNAWLAEQARAAGATGIVTVIPTCIDPTAYREPHVHPDSATHLIRLVWIGSSSTLPSLELLRPTLESLGTALPQLSLRLICDRFLKFENLRVEQIQWSAETEADNLARADIGISWLPDDDWSRGKCGLKVLQYMAAGLPVIANSVGVHNEMITHGVNGFRAETPDQWLAAVQQLASDADLRKRVGEAGRGNVEREYSIAAGLNQWLALLEELGAIRQRRAG